MKIKKEVIECKYEITEIDQKDFDTLTLAFRRALDFYWQYGLYYRMPIGDHPSYKKEMDAIEILSKKFSLQ
jgi:hypothetical protein